MSEFIRLQANGADAYPDASTENTYRPDGTSVESALLDLESNVNTLGGVAGDAKTLAEQNSVKIATAEQEISDINSSLKNINWKLFYEGNFETSAEILLPDNFQEIEVYATRNGFHFAKISVNRKAIEKAQTSSEAGYCLTVGGSARNDTDFLISFTTTKMKNPVEVMSCMAYYR